MYFILVLTIGLLFAQAAATSNAPSNDVDEGKAVLKVAQVGTNLTLPCALPNGEDILDFFTWSRNGILLPDRYSTFLQSRFLIQSDYSLLIVRVAEDDEGNYTCHVQSQPPYILNYIIDVKVPAAIDGRLEETVHQVHEGGDLDLLCLASGRPIPSVSWIHKGRALIAEESVIDVNKSVSAIHRIVNVRRKDAGRYVCEADNGVDTPARAIFIVDVFHPPEIVVEKKWVHAGLGSMTELACSVYSQPLAQVTWWHVENVRSLGSDRQLVPFSSRISPLVLLNGVKHVLRFLSVRDSDLGVYICRAENTFGQAEATIEMSGKASPANLWMVPRSENQASNSQNHDGRHLCFHLVWNVESQSPIYEYMLWLKPRGQPKSNWTSIIVPSNSSALTMSDGSSHRNAYDLCDLAPRVVYDVSIQSRNRFGWSDDSNVLLLSGASPDDSSTSGVPDEEELEINPSIGTSSGPSIVYEISTTSMMSSPVTTLATTTPATTLDPTFLMETVKPTIIIDAADNSEIETTETTSDAISITASTPHFDSTVYPTENHFSDETASTDSGLTTPPSYSTDQPQVENQEEDSPSPVVAPENGINSLASSKVKSDRRPALLFILCLLIIVL